MTAAFVADISDSACDKIPSRSKSDTMDSLPDDSDHGHGVERKRKPPFITDPQLGIMLGQLLDGDRLGDHDLISGF